MSAVRDRTFAGGVTVGGDVCAFTAPAAIATRIPHESLCLVSIDFISLPGLGFNLYRRSVCLCLLPSRQVSLPFSSGVVLRSRKNDGCGDQASDAVRQIDTDVTISGRGPVRHPVIKAVTSSKTAHDFRKLTVNVSGAYHFAARRAHGALNSILEMDSRSPPGKVEFGDQSRK